MSRTAEGFRTVEYLGQRGIVGVTVVYKPNLLDNTGLARNEELLSLKRMLITRHIFQILRCNI